MSYPILYSAEEKNFDHNGLGILGDCISCEVEEEANGIFELTMKYPMDGIHYEDISDRSIIKAKADQFRDPQLFRVYSLSKPMSGVVTILAEHISYDLSGIPVAPFSSSSIVGALSMLKSNAVVECPFDFWTDKTTSGTFRVSVPSSIRSRLGGVEGSILDVYGGEYEFDNYTVNLYNNRGMNRGVSIRYGKNLTDIKQEQNCSNIATGVYPYWAGDIDGKFVLVELPEKIVNAPGTYNFVKIRTLDLSDQFDSRPTIEQLRERAERYVEENEIGVPTVSLTVSFAQLEQSEEYKNLKILERVSLFDTVNVEFPALRVSTTAKAVKIVYDSLAERVKTVNLGSVRSNIVNTIVEQQKEISKAPTKTDLEKAKESATDWLTNGNGYVYFRKDDSGNLVDILFMDEQNIDTAVNVMRIGQSGIGFSHNGVNGPYDSAWGLDGILNANEILAGILVGVLIKSGRIESVNGKVSIDLDENAKEVKFNTGISANGLTVRADEAGAQTLFALDTPKGGENDEYYSQMRFWGSNGKRLYELSETFKRDNSELSGISSRWFGRDSDLSTIVHAGNDAAGFWIYKNDKVVAEFSVNPEKSNILDIGNTKFVSYASGGNDAFIGKNINIYENSDRRTTAFIGDIDTCCLIFTYDENDFRIQIFDTSREDDVLKLIEYDSSHGEFNVMGLDRINGIKVDWTYDSNLQKWILTGE